MHRAFVAPEELALAQSGHEFALPKEVAHKFSQVLRLANKTPVELFDGQGLIVRGLFNKEARPYLSEVVTETHLKILRPLVVVQALIALPKLEQVIQRCTELGATDFILFNASRSQVKWEEKFASKQFRLKKIAQEASRQSGRPDVPEISEILSMKETQHYIENFSGLSVLGDLREKNSLGALLGLQSKRALKGLAVIIGPEGDLSVDELTQLQQAGAHSCLWSPHVLRTETAALAAVAIAQDFFLRQ